ncbi:MULTISPECIES: TusE/DsrC/DsvC family sulfur relay protein [Thiorhodovibrio]|uniref:TusE/DsrC/DsvC family sulfur relay protein n=1 Tax=Thiorhodovibrio TaxID=61593 RepID=UPI0019126CC1|nr:MULTISPECIES: TusE/DsrC/DsvC family sulfur relay protein [Thiorhodovibrio]WPL10674.1 Sulfurtransferase TusE [Thiorhodovibrio litoralis]
MTAKAASVRRDSPLKATTDGNITVGKRVVSTDEEGYLLEPEDWSEEFALALAEREGLKLTRRHWAVIRYMRGYFSDHNVPVGCVDLDTILHFRSHWPRVRGQPRWWPGLFPAGGLRRQGHRLAGLPRVEHHHGCRLDL